MPLTESQKQATVKYKEKNIKRIQAQKGESQSGLPQTMNNLNAFQQQPFTIRSSGRLFFMFTLKDCITQSYERDNEYTDLN